MTTFIETLNHSGDQFLKFAWPMFWQSSLLIAIIFALEFALRRKVRAAIRYALWMVVIVKLLLPPSLALPTGPTWWIHPAVSPPVKAPPVSFTVSYGEQMTPDFPLPPSPVIPPPKAPAMSFAAWTLTASGVVSAGLLAWLLVRWRQINQKVRRANTSEKLIPVVDEARRLTRLRPGIRLKLTEDSMSPAVCGLFRPVILLPQSLVERLSDGQLRAVLLHEAIHLRRGDVWVNCAQALLQIVYWWHPLLWLANARIRRVREEAVDDAVMLALRDDAEIYAPTLLEVAKLAFNRPLASLGLVGILESRSALRQRIERLVNFNTPKKAGLTVVSILGILAFSAVALPMGEAPEKTNAPDVSAFKTNMNPTNSSIATVDNFSNRTDNARNQVTMSFKIERPMNESDLKKLLLDAGVKIPPTVFIYLDSGILLVRGSEEQQDLIERVVLKLNGVSPKEIENIVNRSSKQKAAMTGANLILTNLEMRVFKIATNTFVAGMRGIPGLETNSVQAMVKSFFSAMGVDFTAPGRSIAFNDRLGMLFVKATPSELDTVERVVQALSLIRPEIHIKARFIELPKAGFNPLLFSNTVAGHMTGILNDSEFRMLLHAFGQRNGYELLAEPEVTTLSGRQTQMKVVDVDEIVTNFVLHETPSNSTAIVPQTGEFEIGPTVDLVPNVLADGYTINLTAIAWMRKFLGYDNITNEVFVTNSIGGKIHLPTVSPGFRVKQAVATVNLWDDQTLVLGNLKSDFVGADGQIQNEPKFFQDAEKKNGTADKELLVFITATIVDPAGNRVHSEDELRQIQEKTKSDAPPLPLWLSSPSWSEIRGGSIR